MPWLRVDDGAADHPKVLRSGFEVFGFVALCAAWAAKQTTDGFIPDYVARRVSPDRWQDLIKAAQRAQYLGKPTRNDVGDRGWLLDQSDQLLHMRSKEEVELDRARGKVTRRKEETRLVRLRDGDQCRYCEKTVDYEDRVSARGGTYDHPDPDDRDTFVVCCYGCNREKGARTAQAWQAAGGPDLKAPPDSPFIGPLTAKRYKVPQTAPARNEGVETQPHGAHHTDVDAAPGSANPTGDVAAHAERSEPARPEDLDLASDLPSEVSQTYPVRDGPDRDGSVAQPLSSSPTHRSRGSRGKRKS